jgi:hypothetical protein
MCVICYKPEGVAVPSDDRLEQMFHQNNDGAGYMVMRNHCVEIYKGFMKLKSLRRSLRQNNVSKKDCLVMHFRIATAGSTTAQNTHPFPVTDNLKQLKALHCKTDVAIAHNGILAIGGDKKLDTSDTQEFIRTILASPEVKANLYEPGVFSLLEYAIGSSKFCILDANVNRVTLLGDWVEPTIKDGCMYSNLIFEWRQTTNYKSGKGYVSKSWDYDADKWRHADGNVSRSGVAQFPRAVEKDFKLLPDAPRNKSDVVFINNTRLFCPRCQTTRQMDDWHCGSCGVYFDWEGNDGYNSHLGVGS